MKDRQMMRPLGCIALASMLGVATLLASCAPAAPTPAPGVAPTAPRLVPQAPPEPAAPAKPGKRAAVNLSSPQGPLASSSYVKTVALAELLRRHSDFVRITPVASKGVPENLVMFLRGEAQFLHVHFVDYPQFLSGTGSFAKYGPQSRDTLQIVIHHGAGGTSVVANIGTGVYSVKDLKGKKIACEGPGSTAYTDTVLILGAVGLDARKDCRLIHGSRADITAYLKEGSVDAIIVPHVYVPGVRYATHEEITSTKAVEFIPLSREMIDNMNKSVGVQAYAPIVVPAGFYRGQKADVTWAAKPAYWVVGKDLSEDTVYEIASVFWKHYDEALEISAMVRDADPQANRERLKSEKTIPWHPGALKYYKEAGWI